jgi:hypothetical protein
LFPAVGAEGTVFTVALVEPAELVHPLTVAVTSYVPAIAVVALLLTVGFCDEEVNPFGPVHA